MSLALLLVSNSTNHGQGYLDHCMPEMLDLLGEQRRLAFIPFALLDRDGYGAKARDRFRQDRRWSTVRHTRSVLLRPASTSPLSLRSMTRVPNGSSEATIILAAQLAGRPRLVSPRSASRPSQTKSAPWADPTIRTAIGMSPRYLSGIAMKSRTR